MNLSFAHLPGRPNALRAAVAAILLCITFAAQTAFAQVDPLQAFQAAQQAVARATDADADQYSPDWIGKARDSLSQAQAAAGDKKLYRQAPQLAQRAQAEAELALVQSQAAVAKARLLQTQGDAQALQRQLDTPLPPLSPPPAPVSSAAPADAGSTTEVSP